MISNDAVQRLIACDRETLIDLLAAAIWTSARCSTRPAPATPAQRPRLRLVGGRRRAGANTPTEYVTRETKGATMHKGRMAPSKPNISERPPDWGPWEWRNHLADPQARVYRELPRDAPMRRPMTGLTRACLNLVYSVQFFERPSAWGTIDHLLLRRHDQGLIFPWADLQRIKDELCGPERVAVEVFPPQSQLVDDANCRHLWVLPAGFALPFGLHIEGWKHV